MNEQVRERLRLPAMALMMLGALALALVVGYAIPQQPLLVVGGVVVLLVLTVAVAQPMLLPLLAMPAIVVVERFGAGAVEMTISDWMLGLAFWPAVLFAPRPFSEPLRRMLWLNAIFQAATMFTVIANPFSLNTVEWIHAWLLVTGALVVGWAVGATGHARLGLTFFLVACLALALPTIAQGLEQYARGDLSEVYPRWPWPMHKNFIGTLLGFAAALAYAHPSWMGWTRRPALVAFWVFVAAILVSQSRQALVALAVALLIISFRGQGERRRSVLALLGILPVIALVATIARDQMAEGNVHNSWFQRLDWYAESYAVFLERPWLGWGLRFWRSEGAPIQYEPPHVALEVLTTAGVVGLAGFGVMIVGMLVVLWRTDPVFGTAAFALLLSRLIQGQFDLFWVSISVSVPFLVAGVSLGAAAFSVGAAQSSSQRPNERRLAGVR
ncbi:O-antigen ligase family protein [Ornithinimicrobium cerasi]|uniref:O-antigen ligase family protein n=1 Tax=Ornithinimicrobium cerasi TaxID=2248773 RepID=UPI000EFF54E9|nr:O-antigen ligase family protein [Ornithinimicrobium cerasi]